MTWLTICRFVREPFNALPVELNCKCILTAPARQRDKLINASRETLETRMIDNGILTIVELVLCPGGFDRLSEARRGQLLDARAQD